MVDVPRAALARSVEMRPRGSKSAERVSLCLFSLSLACPCRLRIVLNDALRASQSLSCSSALPLPHLLQVRRRPNLPTEPGVAMEQVWQHLGVSAYNPVRQFQIVYCTWLAIAMLCNMRNHCRFYRWFSSSRCRRTMARACCAPHACCHAPHARHVTLRSLLAAFRSRASEASARTRRRSMAQRPRL